MSFLRFLELRNRWITNPAPGGPSLRLSSDHIGARLASTDAILGHNGGNGDEGEELFTFEPSGSFTSVGSPSSSLLASSPHEHRQMQEFFTLLEQRKKMQLKELANREGSQEHDDERRKRQPGWGQAIGVITSGGDAQGMNAAVRAVVRVALQRGARVYAICEGYKGLLDNEIVEMAWGDVSGILAQGGTVIGTARCDEFKEWEGMKKAVRTLIHHRISKLVVVGGDGSLTGANLLRERYPKLVDELVAEGKVKREHAAEQLLIIGLVGSIDNDMWGTDMTIGADSALHRILEAIDAISSTAASHKRSFVVEVMGRHCGWLALMAGLATGADYVLVPESPVANWQRHMCERIDQGRSSGRRSSIVIVAEGAIDIDGKPIKSDDVKRVLDTELGHDTRVTILGHVQRGGTPSAYDRIMSTRLGAEAVDALFSEDAANMESRLICTSGSSIVLKPLMECVARTKEVARLIEAKKYNEARAMRGKQFIDSQAAFVTFARPKPHFHAPSSTAPHIAVMHAGASSPGMNTAVRAAVRLALDKGFRVFAIYEGFEGLVRGDVREVDWMTVNGWSSIGGSLLGTSRAAPKGKPELQKIADVLERFNIDNLLIIGGWEALEGVMLLDKRKEKFPKLGLTKVLIPATISNNLPATEFSIGSDTSLNNILEAMDKIKQSAITVGRVFVVEVMGAYCGYLALNAALGAGAETVYLPEEGITLDLLKDNSLELVQRFAHKNKSMAGGMGLIVINEKANKVYNTNFVASLFEEEGKGSFSVRKAVLGHLQQGGDPSPIDRIRAVRMAAEAIEFIGRAAATATPSAPHPSAVVGEIAGETLTTPLERVLPIIDVARRRPLDQWWLSLRECFHLLAVPEAFNSSAAAATHSAATHSSSSSSS